MESMSRRGFIGGSAMAVGAMLAGSAASGAAVASAEETTWDREVDIVVCGFGSAGIAAAHEALAQGLEVLVIEKASQEDAGGDSTCFGGGLMPWVADSLIANSMGDMSENIATARAAAQLEAADLAVQMGVTFSPEYKNGGGEVVGGAPAFYKAISEGALAEGVEVLYETAAKKLVQDQDMKEIHGVIAEQDGKEIALKARKAVMMCTGDYSANQTLVGTLHCPKLPLPTVGSPYNTGDGLKMCMAAGATLANIAKGWDWFEFSYRKASEEVGSSLNLRWWTLTDLMSGTDSSTGRDSMVFINKAGQRFMNEKYVITHDKSQHAFLDFAGSLWEADKDYTNLPCFMVCDSKCVDGGPLGKVPGDPVAWTWAAVHGVYTWSDDNQAEIEKGWLYKADTIEELAAQMTSASYVTGAEVTVDAATLQTSIDDYNSMCAAGEDTQFGRSADRLVALDTPPYYAVELIPTALYSIGGTKTDIGSRVLDANDEPIARLYSAGNIGQQVSISPIGVVGCMGDAMLGIRDAATLDDWE